MKKINIKDVLMLIAFILVSQFAGVVGSFFTVNAIPTWYQTLNRPFFAPPNWIFAPVWIALYAMMAIALFLVVKKGTQNQHTKSAVILFVVQLVLNALWSIIFFGSKQLWIAFAEILLLLCFIILTTIKFQKISKTSFVLMLPYIAWVSFATILNLGFAILN
jgi:translocator protein